MLDMLTNQCHSLSKPVDPYLLVNCFKANNFISKIYAKDTTIYENLKDLLH